MDINLHNIEELIFYDNKLQSLFPEFSGVFAQWKLSKMSPSLRSLGKRIVLDFLNDLGPKHIKILSEYFACKVTIQVVDYSLVKNICCGLDEVENTMSEVEGFVDFAIHRNNDQVYICFWR